MNFSIEKIKKKKNINIQVEHCQAIVKQDSEKSKLVKSYNSFKLNHLKTYLWIQKQTVCVFDQSDLSNFLSQ